jgi:hypothetical protein
MWRLYLKKYEPDCDPEKEKPVLKYQKYLERFEMTGFAFGTPKTGHFRHIEALTCQSIHHAPQTPVAFVTS